MMSVDQKRAVFVFEQTLECLEALFSAVGARELSLVRKWQTLLASGQPIDPRDVGLGNRATLGDLILCAENGHKVTDSQKVWVNACLECAAGVAGLAASFLWIYDRLIVKEEFAIGERAEPEIRIITCSRCGASWVDRQEIERVAAAIWAHVQVRAFIEAGRGTEAAKEALSCTSCLTFVVAVEDILQQKSINLAANRGEVCPSCRSGVRYSKFKIEWDEARCAVQKHVM